MEFFLHCFKQSRLVDDKSDYVIKNAQANYKSNNNNSSTTSIYKLTNTKNQSHKDHVEEQFEQIRTACLKMAADSYTKLNLDVPDVSSLF